MVITSRSNPKVKALKALSDKKYRKISGEFMAEGVKMATECMSSGCEITGIYCTEELADVFHGSTVLSHDVFEWVSSEKTPQGVLVTVKIPDISVKPPKGKCLLLDGLKDPGNVGTIIRTANAAGYDEIYLINCTDPFSPKSVRASMSGVFFTEIMQGSAEETLRALSGTPIICADMKGENVFSFTPPEKFCLCIGSEADGISSAVREKARYTVKIPMRSSCESLNAAVSAGILMYILSDAKSL